jgi:membrane protein YqaA with SNARE-associated domain
LKSGEAAVWLLGGLDARLVQRLGGVGLAVLAMLDSFLVPVPGSIDLFTIVLSAAQPGWWPYYAALATAGSLAGGWMTYRVGRAGGKEGLEKRLPKARIEKLQQWFGRWGFGAVFLPALLPPPVPIVPFLLGAGALNLKPAKFLLALGLGRMVRFSIAGAIATVYGKQVIRFFQANYWWLLLALAAMSVAWIISGILLRKKLARAIESEKVPGDQAESPAA